MKHRPSSRHTLKPILLIVLLLISLTSLYSRTYRIKQDGNGDFTTIKAGIKSAQDGDSLLVYPGRYIENLNYDGKNITITSLYGVTSDDRSIVRETIIDGNDQGTVVIFNSGETRNAVLNGFTITNGRGEFHWSDLYSMGGGIFIENASPVISNCHIINNRAHTSSAICLFRSGNPLLKGNTIKYNNSQRYGAVATTAGDNNLVFCSESLNSVYFNNGGRSSDMFFGGRNQSPVMIDTLTVLHPGKYFVGTSRHVPDNFTLTVNHGKIEPIATDLYVSPDGCDSNSGLSFEEPLQTIAMAMMKIKPDSLQQRTIYISEGIYSRSLNNQRFPVQLRSYVDLIGADKDTTILDMETESSAFMVDNPSRDNQTVYTERFKISDFTIVNGGNPSGSIGRGAMHLTYGASLILENIDIANCRTGNRELGVNGNETIWIGSCKDITLRNIHIYNSSGRQALSVYMVFGEPLNLYAENIRIRRQEPGIYYPESDTNGGGVIISYADHGEQAPIDVILVNLELTDNLIDHIDPGWGRTSFSFLSIGASMGRSRVVNTTIGNSRTASQDGAGIKLGGPINHELINSIVYGNSPHQLNLIWDAGRQGNLYVSNSLVYDGEEGIVRIGNPNIVVHWDESNIDADPMWVGEDVNPDYPYMLSENSPARGAGTLDIPDFKFPEYDLAGNPRIVDGKIDMGAYQWHPHTSVEESDTVTKGLREEEFNLRNFPNPAVTLLNHSSVGVEGHRSSTTGTNIAFKAPEAGNVVIEIYNLKGQFVKRVFDAHIPQGEYNVFWDGRDERGRFVATGFYMYNLHFNERLVATGRATFIK